MRVGLLSDIHSNLEALDAVLKALPDVDRIVVLGDIVGYGPDPNGVIDRLRSVGARAVRGNHDQAMLDPAILELFNPHAAAAARWTQGVLTPEAWSTWGSTGICTDRSPPIRSWKPAQTLHLGIHSG